MGLEILLNQVDKNMKNDFIEVDLSDLLQHVSSNDICELFAAYQKSDIELSNIILCYSARSGCLFLSDDNYDSYMVNSDGKFEQWINCQNCNNQGFKSDMKINGEYCSECRPDLFDRKISQKALTEIKSMCEKNGWNYSDVEEQLKSFEGSNDDLVELLDDISLGNIDSDDVEDWLE